MISERRKIGECLNREQNPFSIIEKTRVEKSAKRVINFRRQLEIVTDPADRRCLRLSLWHAEDDFLETYLADCYPSLFRAY